MKLWQSRGSKSLMYSWAPPAVLEGGARIACRGRVLSAFSQFSQWSAHVCKLFIIRGGGGGGGAIQSSKGGGGGGGLCPPPPPPPIKTFSLITCYSAKWIAYTTWLNPPPGNGFNVRVYASHTVLMERCNPFSSKVS